MLYPWSVARCPSCSSERMYRRRVPWFARLAKRFTTRRPYMCPSCGWRGWRTPLLDPSDHVPAQSELSDAHSKRPELSRSDVIRWSAVFALGLVVGAFVVWRVSQSALETSSGEGTPVTASRAAQPNPPTPPSTESSEAQGTIGRVSKAEPAHRSVPPGAQRGRVPPASSRVVASTIERRSAVRNQPAAERSEDVARASATAAAALARGTLMVNSVPPGARVSLDGRVVGSTPLVLKDVPAGTHLVRLEADGYQVWAWTARVVANQVDTLTIKLVTAPIDSRQSARHDD